MKILHIYFYLLVCCGAAESFQEKSVDLGQNVTLKCEVSVKDVFWFLMKPSEPPVFILRSFSSQAKTANYNNMTFSKTFSLQYNSSLFIHNINTNQLGVYYCIPTASPYISRGIRLYIQNHSAGLTQSRYLYTAKVSSNSVQPVSREAATKSDNQTCRIEEPQNRTGDIDEIRLWRNLFITSGIINCVVIVGVTVSIISCCGKNNKSPNCDVKLQGVSGSESWRPKAQNENSYTVVEFILFQPGM